MKKIAKVPVEIILRILFNIAEAYVLWYDRYSAFDPSKVELYE